MEEEVKDIIATSLQKARDHVRTGNVGKAYAYYTVVIELCPPKRPEIEETFVDVLCQWGIELSRDGRFSDVQLCYERSLDIYPNNPRILNNFAAHLLRNNHPVRAIPYLKRALQIDPDFLPAERNLQNAFSMVVERWHFPMLNDKIRNNAFEQAIRNRVSEGYNTVLDVGTGTGLLSLYAHNAGAKNIYACECSPVMVNIAKNVFQSNNSRQIKLIPKHSSDLKIPTDIPERVKLVVTETFDAGLFGELVLPSMINVHNNLMEKNGVIIPMNATLFVAAVNCEYLRHKTSVMFDKVKHVCSLNFPEISVLLDDEYYDTESLQKIQFEYITDPVRLLTVNFNNLSELKEFSKDGIKRIISTRSNYDCIIDGLVTWFELELCDGIRVSSLAEKSCWQFAVYPSLPKSCKKGDALTIKTEMLEDKLKCSYSLETPELHDYNENISPLRLPMDIIMFLNDFEYLKLLCDLSKFYSKRETKSILDTSPFPIYGLMYLKEHKLTETMYYKTENSTLRGFIERVAECNGVKEKLRFISNYDEIQYPLDLLFVHDFDIKGEMKDESEEENRSFLRCLIKPSGVMLPEQVFLMGQLVFSKDLPNMVYVNDANLQNSFAANFNGENVSNNISNKNRYDIARYINEYKIDQVFDLNWSLYSCETRSDAQTMIEMKNSEVTENIANFGKVDITGAQPLPNALIFWYKVKLTANQIYSTNRTDSFMNHTAMLLDDKLRNKILQNQEIRVKVQQVRGLIKVKVL